MQVLTKRDKDAIIYLVTKKYKSVTEIAKLFSRSRQAIYDVLKQRKVKIKDYIWIDVSCDYCGAEFKKRRCYVRYSKRDFCNIEHMVAYMKEHGMDKWFGRKEDDEET